MRRYFILGFRTVLLGLVLLLGAVSAWAQSDEVTPQVVVLTIKGAITPAMQEYLRRGLQLADDRQAELVILQLDTPGGSINVMNEMIQEIRGSSMPVVVYVAPQNAIAGSAGAIITLAGHLSAMAPETTIGAASPVGAQGEDIGEAMDRKVKEILRAKARELTRNRSPEAVQLAEQMIEEARAVTVEEALTVGLVDLSARSLTDLLRQLDGRKVQLLEKEVILHTQFAEVQTVDNTFIERLLQLLVDPNLVFLLLSLGTWAVLIELSSPGGWVAGFIGAVCLLLAIYGLGILPVNWFGILFIVLAFVLFILELKVPGYGMLTVAGLGSFIIGALVLFNTIRFPRLPGAPPAMPGFSTVSLPLVIGTAVFIAVSFFAIVTYALRAQRAPLSAGRETLPGQLGIAQTTLSPRGTVHVAGEQWGAELASGEPPIAEGEQVEVVRVEGLRLIVRRAKR